jgi:zinc transport system substrate-binding protein
MSRRNLFWFLGALFLFCCLGFAGCSRAHDPWKSARAGQKHILVTFPPLYSLTHAIAGDDAYVLCFLTTTGPHEYEFSPTDAIKAKGAHLIIHNGLELDDALVEKLNNQAKVPTLAVGKALPEDKLLEMGDDDEPKGDEKAKKEDKHARKHGGKEGHAHHHGAHDPHIWLGPPEAMLIVDAIAAKLAEIDSQQGSAYGKRAELLKEKLKKLHDEGMEQFKSKKNLKVVTMHDSMGYFARAFGLEVVGTILPQPGAEIEAARIAKLEDLCKKKQVGLITYEPQYTDTQPKLLQKQLKNRGLDVRLAEFDPLETAPLSTDSVNPDADYYLRKMRENIDRLARELP